MKRILRNFALPLWLLLSSSFGNPAPQFEREILVPALVPGPDVIVGDLPELQQFGSSGTQVGLALATTSCNNGDHELNWLGYGNTTHPVAPQNLYRMSGGPSHNDRFEQIGQSWLKHGIEAVQEDACGFGCIPAKDQYHLGAGCSDPYFASLNASQGFLGSRAWVNPFTGAFPATSIEHSGHSHTGTSHRILVEASDLNTTLNPGATYYAEAQYATADEYAWCQSHPGQCNMYNNASYRRFDVTGTTSFTFAAVGATVQMTPGHPCLDGSDHPAHRAGARDRWPRLHRLEGDQPVGRRLAL